MWAELSPVRGWEGPQRRRAVQHLTVEQMRHWQPTCSRPENLVVPVRRDPTGRSGPTKSQTRGSRWRCCAHGWYVPSAVNSERVEQRILEQAVRLTGYGAITSWASLRWQGASYFTGEEFGARLPVPLLRTSGDLPTQDRGATFSREQLPPQEIRTVAGVKCTVPTRAIFDEVRRLGELRSAVVALDMTMAAGLISLPEFTDYVHTRQAWQGVPLARKALTLSAEGSRSPQESRMRLIWMIDAGLPAPLLNQPLFDVGGTLLGVPDLFDPLSGVIGEYDGVDHKDVDRHRRDVAREERYRDHGLEYFTIVGGDMQDRSLCVRRMLRAQHRATTLPRDRSWTLEQPDWWKVRHTTR